MRIKQQFIALPCGTPALGSTLGCSFVPSSIDERIVEKRHTLALQGNDWKELAA